MFKTILFVLALTVMAGTSFAADGSIQRDPIFPDNFIVRDKDGAWLEYLLKDPVIDNRWIRYKKNKKAGSLLRDPIIDSNWLIWDTDPVGE